jgi:hypothetical protein
MCTFNGKIGIIRKTLICGFEFMITYQHISENVGDEVASNQSVFLKLVVPISQMNNS